MNGAALHVELAAPERSLLRLEAEEVFLPGAAGLMAIRAEHTPLLTALTPGVVKVRDMNGEERFFSVGGGFAEVRDDKVVVLAQTIEEPGDIDVTRAEAARERAMERLTARTNIDIDVVRAELALARALARIQTTSRQLY